MSIEDKIQEVHRIIQETFPEAVCVEINVTSDGINVATRYTTDLENYTMRTINGKWVKKVNKL